MINKDTEVCISMAAKAGNFGCSIHNSAFNYLQLNYIYKSFSVEPKNLHSAIDGMRSLNIRGAGITMPHKIRAIEHCDVVSEEVKAIGSTNTLVNDKGIITCYNTDAYSSYTVLKRFIKNYNTVYILGDGGYSKAVRYSAQKLFSNVNIINRNNWGSIENIENSIIFNCTPVKNITVNKTVKFIDCDINSKTGQELALLQASKQFSMYTGVDFPMQYITDNFNNIII